MFRPLLADIKSYNQHYKEQLYMICCLKIGCYYSNIEGLRVVVEIKVKYT
jgi:hypothetical protein